MSLALPLAISIFITLFSFVNNFLVDI